VSHASRTPGNGCGPAPSHNRCCTCAQLEEAAVRELQSQNVQEPGVEAADYSDLQVLLTSSQDFGPASIRELTVRSHQLTAVLRVRKKHHVRA